MAELADLADVAMIWLLLRPRREPAVQHITAWGNYISTKKMQFLPGSEDKLALLIKRSDGRFVVANSCHCVVDEIKETNRRIKE